MDNAMRALAEVAARLVLQAYRECHADWTDDQTPVDALAAWLGLQVETFHPADYAVGTYGFMDPDEDENLIWLCRDMPLRLHRFTLAHELGHAILHCQTAARIPLAAQLKELGILAREQEITARTEYTSQMPDLSRADPCNKTDVQEDMPHWQDNEQFQDSLGLGQTYDPRSQRELAANLFAAELLIPQQRLRSLYLEEQVMPATLAARFGVSAAALLNRLAGLLKDTTATSEPAPEKVAATPPANNVGAVAKKQYDEFQQAAIEAPTPALIVAGPGSGKTSTLIGRCEYLIRAQGIAPQQILALTFSRKASQEMEERLQLVLQDGVLPRVSTFHAFCADLLRQYSSYVGLRNDFMLIDEAEGYFLLRQQDQAMRLQHYQMLQNPTFHFPAFLKAISRAKDELVSPLEYAELAQRLQAQATDEDALEKAEQAQEVALVYTLYHQALQQRGDTDFGGLLTLTLQLFQQHPEILYEQQTKFQHILVDEFQDVNRASGVLLRELAGAKQQVWIVGDANQAIYGFRGASAANISQFTEDFPGAVVLPLSRNYRSRPDLVALAETFRGKQLETEEAAGKNQPVRTSAPDCYITFAEATDEASEYAGIVQDIRRKIQQGYSYKDIMVLSRTRSMVQKITHALAEAGLPSVEQGGVLEQVHIKDVISIILLLTDASAMGLLRASRCYEHPLTQQDIEALLQVAHAQKRQPRMLILAGEAPLTMSVEGRRTLLRLAQILQTLQHAPDVWSLLAQYLLIETTLVRDQIVHREPTRKNRILRDYDQLLQMARHYDQQQQARLQRMEDIATQEVSAEEDGPSTPALPALEDRARGFLEYLTLLLQLRQDNGSREADDDEHGGEKETIRVMTVHASKGLEFPIVYMPGLVQRKFPLQARAGAMPALTGLLDPAKIERDLHTQGEAYLFYVGITRARDQLVLSYSRNYGKSSYKRSPYLDTLEASMPEERMQYLQWEMPHVQEIAQEDSEDQAESWSAQPDTDFINAMRPQVLRSSAIEAYLRCPREYAYRHIYHFSSDNTAYSLFWQATQKTVAELRKQLPADEETESASSELDQQGAQALYSQHWEAVGGPAAYFARMYEEHGQKVIEALRRKLSTHTQIRWDVHTSLPVEISGKTVHVSVDRIETSEQTDVAVKFVRTRFGKQKEKPVAEARDLFYTLAYRQHHPQQKVEVHNHNMSTDEVSPISISARKEQGLYNEIEQAIKGLEQQKYPTRPDPFRCPNCAYFLICPA